MAAKPLKLKIDFAELFGTEIKDDALRQAIGGAIIDKITERTQSGVSLKGRPFKGYSNTYVKSLTFKVHGKSKGSVDLTLSGDMLSSMEILDNSPKSLTIGFNNELDNAKAYNHNVGDTLPKREFFGVTQKEKLEIKNQFADVVTEINQLRESKTRDEFLNRATSTINKLLDENTISALDSSLASNLGE